MYKRSVQIYYDRDRFGKMILQAQMQVEANTKHYSSTMASPVKPL